MPAVEVRDLVKDFPGRRALDGVSLRVSRGEVLALLGPNGAGKSTLVRILATLLPPDSGTAVVDGHDVAADPAAVRRSVGMAGQNATVDGMLTGHENLRLVAKLRGSDRRTARRTADDLLARVGLTDSGGRVVSGYSGGMRRRLDLAAALIGDPPLLILDEPTTGLDPESRFDIWDAVAELSAGGTTVLLTTQYLEEADRLADRITVLDRGRVIAAGTGDELKAAAGADRLVLVVAEQHQVLTAAGLVAHACATTPAVDPRARRVEVAVTDGQAALARVLAELARADVRVLEIGLSRPTLDDVFLALTSRRRTAVPG